MTITADLTDAPRKLLHAEIEIPVKAGPFTFTAAKWIPGNHSPTGPIGEFAGIFVTGGGQRIPWRRDDVDMYAFHVIVPDGVTRLHIVDMLIRKLTNGEKSLHDFCLIFFAKGGDTGPLTVPYDFDELISDLRQVVPSDWASFLRASITSFSPHADADGITQSGWRLIYADKPSSYERAAMGKTTDAYFSLGLLVKDDGTIGEVRFFSPSFDAKLSPGEKIVTINGRASLPQLCDRR